MAAPAAAKSPPKSAPKSSTPSPTPSPSKGAGRPRKSFAAKLPGRFKRAATGETRNSPMTDPNIIFWLGISLILAAGWTSKRIPNLWTFATNPGSGANAGDFLGSIKSTFVQLIFVFLLAISARAVPPLASIWLILLIGLWTLWLIKNPSFVTTLAGWAKP